MQNLDQSNSGRLSGDGSPRMQGINATTNSVDPRMQQDTAGDSSSRSNVSKIESQGPQEQQQQQTQDVIMIDNSSQSSRPSRSLQDLPEGMMGMDRSMQAQRGVL